MFDIEKWDRRYESLSVEEARPAVVLAAHTHLLPAVGDALDLACGMGGNARLLAERGLRTQAWELSGVAVAKIQAYAQQTGLPLVAKQRDIERDRPPAEAFDVIVVAHYLDRAVVPSIAKALRPGGLLFYQTFTREAVDSIGPRSEHYRLRPNELLRLFPRLRVLAYREEGRVGDLRTGWRNEALLVALKT